LPKAYSAVCPTFPPDPDDNPEDEENSDAQQELDAIRGRYLGRLDSVATNFVRLFERMRSNSRHTRLSVITFGNAEPVDEVHHVDGSTMWMLDLITYKVRSQVTEIEDHEYWAERIEGHETKYEEPIGSVEFMGMDQGLAAQPYQ